MYTLFFFDDTWLWARTGFRRRLGRPQLISEGVYQDPETIICTGSPVVSRRDEGGYIMFYGGFPIGSTPQDRAVPLAAFSDDGLSWKPIDTRRLCDIPDRLFPNQIMSGKDVNELALTYRDEYAEPQARFKALTLRHDMEAVRERNELWVSPDGLRWRKCEGVCWHRRGAEPGVGLCWNPTQMAYTLTVRPDWGERRIAVCETHDFISFTEPKWCMQADALDQPLDEIYGMPIFLYKGLIIGFPWLFHVDTNTLAHKFWRGRIDAQFAYSLNGLAFQRSLREPLFPNGEFGEPDFSLILPSSIVVLPDGNLRIYGFARTIEHGPFRRQEVSSIVAYSLREDGFVYLESIGGIATLRTREMLLNSIPSVNLCTNVGATCAILGRNLEPLPGFAHEDCTRFVGDSQRWIPVFQKGVLGQLLGRIVILEIKIETGRLYSISGEMQLLSGTAANRYEKTGIVDSTNGF